MADFFVHKHLPGEQAILWPAGRPKDVPGIPAQPRIIAALAKWKCTAKVVHNGYDVVNEHGDALVEPLPFGCSLEDWEQAIEDVGSYRGV